MEIYLVMFIMAAHT